MRIKSLGAACTYMHVICLSYVPVVDMSIMVVFITKAVANSLSNRIHTSMEPTDSEILSDFSIDGKSSGENERLKHLTHNCYL